MKKLIKKILSGGALTYSLKTNDKKVVLTFDDGPSEKYTRSVLEILDKNSIKAVFFVCGEQALKYPELLKLIRGRGHIVANHSYAHTNDSDVCDGMKMTEEIIRDITGKSDMIFRPPWGRVTFKLISYCRANKIRIFLWSLDSEDYKIKDARSLTARMAMREISPGEIILFHDDYGHTVEALPEIIAGIKSRGFSFTTLT